MKQFDVFDNPDREGRRAVPFVLVMPHERFLLLPQILVAPLLDGVIGTPDGDLFVTVPFGDRTLILDVMDMSSIARRHLRRPVGSLAAERDRIVKALDLLVSGY